MKKRAITIEQKIEILSRLEVLWTTGDNQYLRFMQMLINCFGGDVYYLEDYDFIEQLEKYYSNLDKTNEEIATKERARKVDR